MAGDHDVLHPVVIDQRLDPAQAEHGVEHRLREHLLIGKRTSLPDSRDPHCGVLVQQLADDRRPLGLLGIAVRAGLADLLGQPAGNLRPHSGDQFPVRVRDRHRARGDRPDRGGAQQAHPRRHWWDLSGNGRCGVAESRANAALLPGTGRLGLGAAVGVGKDRQVQRVGDHRRASSPTRAAIISRSSELSPVFAAALRAASPRVRMLRR